MMHLSSSAKASHSPHACFVVRGHNGHQSDKFVDGPRAWSSITPTASRRGFFEITVAEKFHQNQQSPPLPDQKPVSEWGNAIGSEANWP
jgi:hypothetical protein